MSEYLQLGHVQHVICVLIWKKPDAVSRALRLRDVNGNVSDAIKLRYIFLMHQCC